MSDKFLKFEKALLVGVVITLVAIYAFKKPKTVLSGGRSIIVGDSHAVGIHRLLNNVEKSCAVGGWTVNNLSQCLRSQTVDAGVGKVFISIGTNGLYSSSDKIEDLVDLLKEKYPNATLYIYGGSYGWSGSLSRAQVEDRRNNYYKRFKNKGVNMLKSELGYFNTDSGAHSTSSPQAKSIANEINSIT